MRKKCVICRKYFETESKQVTCSEKCLIEKKIRQMRWSISRDKKSKKKVGRPSNDSTQPNGNDTLCWTCQNACGGCNWSKRLKPVEGWTVENTEIKHTSKGKTRYDSSCKVISCPEYIQDEPR